MFAFKYALLVAACLILTASASPIEFEDLYKPQLDGLEYQYDPILVRQVRSPYGLDLYDAFEPELEPQLDALEYQYEPVLVRQVRSPYGDSYDLDLYDGFEPELSRQARSPQGGNLNVGVTQDDFGRHANVDYTHNIYSSSDGRGSIDAYAQASRNFDSNRNDFNGGIVGRWRF